MGLFRRRRKKKNRLLGYVIFAFVLYCLFSYASPAVPGHALIHGSVHGGTLSCAGLERLWVAAGGSSSAAFLAAEVAKAESGGQQYAAYHNTDGSTDEGYWQINNYAHPGMATYDPLGNAESAVTISRNGTDWTPWVTYNKGLEVGQC